LDEEAARELLDTDLTGQLPVADGEPDPCPSCGTEWHYVDKGTRWLFASLLFNPFLFLAFLAVPLWRPRLRCRNCGRRAVLPVTIRPERVLALILLEIGIVLVLIGGSWVFLLFWQLTHLGPYNPMFPKRSDEIG
jgi:hypothetical protein